METANIQPSPADIQRAKDNDAMATKIQADADKRKDSDSQEPILVTDATKGILERQGITNVITQEELDKREKDADTNTVVNTVKEAISKPAEKEGQQVNKAEVNDVSNENVDLTEDEYNALERAGITEEQILESDGTLQQIKELAQTQLKKEQGEVKPTKPQDESSMVISDEYAEQLALTYPFAKSLKGKTMEDVMGILSQQNQYITKIENSKGIVKDPEDIDKNNSQTDNSDKDLSDEEVIDFLNLSPEEAGKKLRALMKRTANAVTQEAVAKEVKKLLPDLEGLQQTSNERHEKEFYSQLQEQLPEGTDPTKIVEEWKKVNVNMPDATKLALSENVELLITTIADSYKLGKLSKENTDLINNQNSEVRSQTFSKVKELIKKSKTLGVHNGQFNFKRKEAIDITGDPKNATESLLDPIIKRNLNRL